MKLVPCESDGCNTIVSDPTERYCRSCRAKRASVKGEAAKIPPPSEEPWEEESILPLGYNGEPIPKIVPEGTIVPFYPDWLAGLRTLIVCPRRPFKPLGLMIWSTDARALIYRATVGHRLVFPISAAPLPVSFFGMAKTYEEVYEQVKAGNYPPSAITWPVCMLGCQIALEVEGRIDAAVLWGLTIP